MDITIGTEVWYRERHSHISDHRPIKRESFKKTQVSGENRQSWLVRLYDWQGDKDAVRINKKTLECSSGNVFFSEEEVDCFCRDHNFLHGHRYHIETRVGRINDAELLRKVAELIGYTRHLVEE